LAEEKHAPDSWVVAMLQAQGIDGKGDWMKELGLSSSRPTTPAEETEKDEAGDKESMSFFTTEYNKTGVYVSGKTAIPEELDASTAIWVEEGKSKLGWNLAEDEDGDLDDLVKFKPAKKKAVNDGTFHVVTGEASRAHVFYGVNTTAVTAFISDFDSNAPTAHPSPPIG
jgi:hypothetical protein